MTTTTVARPALASRPLLLFFGATFGASTSFYLLLTVVGLYAVAIGPGSGAAGAATAFLMLSTVGAELATPRLVNRFGYRAVFAAGLALLGLPAFLLLGTHSTAAVLAVCLLRGLGFGCTVVVGSALVAVLVPPSRRSEGLGLFGAVAGLPGILALPLGVWMIDRFGYATVFSLGALAALVVLPLTIGLPDRASAASRGARSSLPSRRLVRPAAIFTATALASGVVVTFLPLAVTGSASIAAFALLAQAAATTFSRWWAGRVADRYGCARPLVLGAIAASSGIGLMAFTGVAAAVVGGAILFGIGFGVVQNSSLTMMFEGVEPSGFGAVSAVWNVAYDAGMGLGAAGFGVLAGSAGYPVSFVVTAAAVPLMMVAVRRLR